MIIVHHKNRHRAALFMIKRVNGLSMSVTFGPSARYDVGHDQSDWNKLFGVKERYFKPRRNSSIYVWRYAPGYDRIECGIYEHDETGKALHPKIIRSIEIGRQITLTGIDRRGWLSLPWFGGTSKAPHRITFEASINP